jgi:hypothetical protein
VCRPWIKGNGGVEEGRKGEGRDERKKKKRKGQRRGYRVGGEWGKEKERGRVGRWINRREKRTRTKTKKRECGVLYR